MFLPSLIYYLLNPEINELTSSLMANTNQATLFGMFFDLKQPSDPTQLHRCLWNELIHKQVNCSNIYCTFIME